MSHLLVVNLGSSSVKLRVVGDDDRVVASADVAPDDPSALADFVRDAPAVDAVVHRIVHGGPDLRTAVIVDAEMRSRLDTYASLAPLHQPRALRALDDVARLVPDATVIACFDTAFHATLPEAAWRYAVPAEWTGRWPIRRYGFHGLSHAWASRRGAELAGISLGASRIVTCHIGSGSSCCAVRDGRSVDTTMGFTPLEGLVMATRSGSVDPGLLLWLLDEQRLTLDELRTGLQSRGGLTALAGGDGDTREILAAATRGDDRAAQALGVWAHRFRAAVAAMVAATDGIDVLVFTGGAGEHQPELRRLACAGLEWLGVQLDAERNEATTADGIVGPPASTGAVVVVVSAREDLQMAAEARALLTPPPP